MSSGFIMANGLRIHYDLAGAPAAPVVMMCHGLLGTLDMWAPQVAPLSKRYRVLRFDNRGHGRTAVTPPPYDVDQLARDAIGLLDALAIERVHFVGCSLGGMIGQSLGAHHGARLSSLMLVGSRSAMGPVSMWEERIRIARSQGIAPLVPTMLDRWFTPAFRATHPEAVEAVAKGVRATPVDGFVGACMAIRDMDHTALLRRIAVPTLVTCASEDPGVPIEDARFTQASIPGAGLEVVDGARHLFTIERAAQFTPRLEAWVAAH